MPEPLAYFLTWTTYGTWLPGDERSWVSKKQGVQLPQRQLEQWSSEQLLEPPCILNDEQRALVEQTIREHCDVRKWELYAVNCRTNHVHVVVAAPNNPTDVRDQFKAWSTRRLKELNAARGKNSREKWWTTRGSQRYIGDEESLEAAIRYVLESQ